MIGQVVGQYRIVAHLGAGGMGVVFRARDERLNRDVALKVLLEGLLADDAMRQRFRREALAVAGLNHPNIGTVYNIETHGDLDFLVMEYIPGMTLHHRLAEGPLSEAQVRSFGAQIASALEESHAHGVIHRDLKPGNILVTPKDQIKVVDFGLAEVVRPHGELDVTAPLTQLPEMMGTLPYMAPEQLRGYEIRPAIDIYGLGTILYEMATGQRPFPQATAPLLAEAILRDPPVAPRTLNPNISGALEHTIMRALAKDPAVRIASAAEIGAELRSATTEVDLDAAVARRSPRPAVWAAIAAAIVIAIGAAAYMWRGASAVSAAADVTSVVALPAQVFAEAPDQFLTDAIPSALSTALNEVPSLETKLPPTSVDFQNSGRNIDKVVSAYGVNALLLSSVTVTGDRLSLDLKLVDSATRRLLWSHVYEGARLEYLGMIRDSAAGLRAAMRPGLAAADAGAAVPGGSSSEAELLMRAGVYHASLFSNRGLAANYEQARSALERSLALMPTRAEPAWRLARLYAARVVTGVPPSAIVPDVRTWARRALEIDPKASSAWAALSEAEQIDPKGDPRLMLEFALRATALGPDDAYAQSRLAAAARVVSLSLGLEAQRRATALEPLSLTSPIGEGINLAALGRYPEALSRIDYALAIEPDMPFGVLMKTLTLVVADRTAQATALLPQLDRMVAEKRLRPEWLQLTRDYVTYGKNDRNSEWEQARERLRRLARGEIPFPRWETATAEVASLFARLGDAAGALDLLEARHAKGALGTLDYLLQDPHLSKLRGEPRFDALVAKLRSDFRGWTELVDLARARGEFPQYLEAPYTTLLARTAS